MAGRVRISCISLAQLVILALPGGTFAANVVVSGSLERVVSGSIFVRLADDRLIDARLAPGGDLAAANIVAHYNLADQVQITCGVTTPFYDPALGLHQFLELKKLKRLRPASPESLALVKARLSRQPGANLLKGGEWQPAAHTAEAQALLERVRKVNLGFAENLPNFAVDETGKRSTAPLTARDWQYLDTIESELTFRGGQARREHIRVDGKPWDRPFADIPGPGLWGVFFGTQLRPLLRTQCATTVEFEGREMERGRPALSFRFASPPDACFRLFHKGPVQFNPARTGRFLVEDPGGNMVRYEEEAIGFPEDFGLDRHVVVESWDYVRIGDATHLLPVHVEIMGRSGAGGWSRDAIDYTNYRHFEASTSVSYH